MMIATSFILMLLTLLLGVSPVGADVGDHWHAVAGAAGNTPGVTEDHCDNRISAGESCAFLTNGVETTPALQIMTPGSKCTMIQATANVVEMQQGMGTLYVTLSGYILTDANDLANTTDQNGIWQSVRGNITTHAAAGLLYVNCK